MPALRKGAGVVALLLTVLGAAVLAAPTAGAAPGRCQAGTGVTVVVDYGALGRSTGIGCDPGGGGDPASRVVPAAGFPITYTAGQPFVCRIDGLPDSSQEACNNTPPADAYWGLFWNDGKGGGWVYSSQGVASLRVPTGGSIGWAWQDGGSRDLPGESPNPAPAPTPTKPPSNGGGGSSHSATPTPTPSATQSATPSSSPSASASASEKAAATKDADRRKTDQDEKGKDGSGRKKEAPESESPSPSGSASADAGDELTATTPTSGTPSDDGSDEVLLLAGAAAVVLLGGAAGIMAWRRRA